MAFEFANDMIHGWASLLFIY